MKNDIATAAVSKLFFVAILTFIVNFFVAVLTPPAHAWFSLLRRI